MAVFLLFALALPVAFLYADTKALSDLTKAYEIWKFKGIKYVVRDKDGNVVSSHVGKLESWGGESKWVIRNDKGQFLTHAYGRIENWKNGRTRLVLRSPKGHLLTHIDIAITSNASFAQNVVGLRRLNNDKFARFVQETISDIINEELKNGDLVKARVLLEYISTHKNISGISRFKPVLKNIIKPLNFLAVHNQDPKAKEALETAQKLLGQI